MQKPPSDRTVAAVGDSPRPSQTRPRAEPLPKSPLRNLRANLRKLTAPKRVRLAGIWVCTDPEIVPKSVRSGAFNGTYELAESILVQQAVRAGDKVIEIGCGTGFVSLLAASITGPENVQSFEANDALEPIIRKNHKLNDMASSLTFKAVTRDGQPVTFHRNTNLLSSSLFERNPGTEAIEVPAISLSELTETHRPNVSVMDIEGAEVDILTAADLSSLRAVIVEVHPHIVGQERVEELLDAMAEQGLLAKRQVGKNVLLERV